MIEEQIEEMAKVTMKHCKIENRCGSCHWSTCNECLAEVLYKAGYHKQSALDGEKKIMTMADIVCMGENNMYRVIYKGKEFIGQIRTIDAVYEQNFNICGDRVYRVNHYSVTLVEKDTGVIIMGIVIKNISDLEEIKE